MLREGTETQFPAGTKGPSGPENLWSLRVWRATAAVGVIQHAGSV